jgi:predicted transcriptional regulator
MKKTVEIDVPDKLNAYIESLAKFVKKKPDTIIRRTVADAVKSIPNNVEKHIDPAKLKKIYKLK